MCGGNVSFGYYGIAMATRKVRRRRRSALRRPADPVAERLFAAERLFQEFKALTPYRYKPFGKSFESFDEYERWKRAQKNPWYR